MYQISLKLHNNNNKIFSWFYTLFTEEYTKSDRQTIK